MRVRNNSTLNSPLSTLYLFYYKKEIFTMKKLKPAKNNCRLFCLRFTFSVEDEFSCKEIPHIDKDNSKALADNIVLVNRDK